MSSKLVFDLFTVLLDSDFSGTTKGFGRGRAMVPLKLIEYGFGHIIIRYPYTPYSIYLRGTIESLHPLHAVIPIFPAVVGLGKGREGRKQGIAA